MKPQGNSRKFEVANFCLQLIGTAAMVITSVIALCISKSSNEISKQSLEVSKVAAGLQVRLDEINQDRKEPSIVMLMAGGTKNEFIYTLQNTGEKDAVILQLTIAPSDEHVRNIASRKEFVASQLQRTEGFDNRIDLIKVPFTLRYELGTPIIIGPGGVARVILALDPSIPYGVIRAVYNDFKSVELSHTHINRGTLE